MIETFDIMVAGLGANGSSALYHLAKTNQRIIGIDKFTPPHTHGSSHGESRIIRQAYYEDPIYVPLLKEAYILWNELEHAANKKLFLRTGGLMLGPAHAEVVAGSKLSADTHHIPYEYLDAPAIRQRFPAFHTTDITVGVLEKEAGILYPETCIETFLQLAVNKGATIHYNESIQHIDPKPGNITVTTTKNTYIVKKLILSVGAWTSQLIPELNLPLSVRRQTLHWFKNAKTTRHEHYTPDHMPIYIWEYAPDKMFYGFPDIGAGIKIARHHGGYPIDPDNLEQKVSSEEIEEVTNLAKNYLGIDPIYQRSAVCMYTNTPDGHFIIDHHPQHKNIIIASPCSGHGFKFSSLTGRLLADMALDKDTGFDLAPFSIDRAALS
jgi:sarcosine oxidase